jgi:Vitamin K-dependent gamma-carboxylase
VSHADEHVVAGVERFVLAQRDRIFAPQPIERLAALRIFLPLAILGFLASRLVHADDWLSTAGFHPPQLIEDWRQPLGLAPVSPTTAWLIAAGLVIAGLGSSLGLATRAMTAAFAGLLAYTTLADRLEAFTVSKLGTVLVIALAVSPCGARASLDAWWRGRRDPARIAPTRCAGGSVRFFQILIPVFYFSSGVCKATGDWLRNPYVLWSHLHDSYQTPVSLFAANHAPSWMWTVIQATTLAFEVGAPLWFGWRRTRPYALIYGVAMHAMIGLMFGPVIWFSLLMIVVLVAGYAPIPRLGRRAARAGAAPA